MSIPHDELDDFEAIMGRLLDNLAMASSMTGAIGTSLRTSIGDLRANFFKYLLERSFSEKLLACFTAAREAKVKLGSLAYVRQQLILETSTGLLTSSLILLGLVYCLAAESRMVTDIEFTSRDDAETMMKTMKVAFDDARDFASEYDDPGPYQALTGLAGSLTNHLAATARPLPRVINFSMKDTFPSLFISQRIYYDPSRSEEIAAENHIIHPAFCLRELRGLAS